MRATPIAILVGLAQALGIAAAGAAGEPFLDAYRKAQPIIQQAVEAHGGIERINAIETLHLRQTGQAHLRHQSPTLERFITNETWTEIAYAPKEGKLMVENGGPFFAARTLTRGEETQAIDPRREVYSGATQIDHKTHFVHRIVPALLAKKLHDRARSVVWLGESDVEGSKADALAIAWDDGTLYTVHVDRRSHLITQYDILFPDPVDGDALFESVFSEYRSVDGIPMPMRRHQAVNGTMTFDVRNESVAFGGDIAAHLEIPAGYRRVAQAPDPETELREIAAGVYVGNGNYQNMFIELDDYVVAVDAGGNIAGDLDQLKTRVNGKPIRYAVLTHHHTDHSGGIDALVAEGAEVVTRRENEGLVKRMIARKFDAANAQEPDAGAPRFMFVDRRQVFESGGRRVEIHHVPNEHAEDYLVVYLPQEKILYGADVFVLPAAGPLPKNNSQFESFYRQLAGLGIEPYTVVNAHGRMGTIHDLHAWAQNN